MYGFDVLYSIITTYYDTTCNEHLMAQECLKMVLGQLFGS